MCGHELFVLMSFILLELEIKGNIPFVAWMHREKFTFSLVKLKMAWKTHCLSHDIQSKGTYESEEWTKMI